MIEHEIACEGIRMAGHAPEPCIERGRNTRPASAWWPRALLVGLVLVFFWDSFLAGKAPLMRDTFADFMPWRMFGREAFRAATLPLWNPYSHAGQPFIANPQTAFFYPPHLLFYLLPPVFALKAWLAFHIAVAAVSMHALARQWRMGTAASLVAAVGFAFGTYTVTSMEYQSLLGVYAWFPLALLLTSRLVDDWESHRRFSRMIPTVMSLSIVLALQYLSGHPETFLRGIFIDVAYLATACWGRLVCRKYFACGAAFILAGIFCLGLCMTQFLLTWQLIPLSIRGGNVNPGLEMASLHPRLLICWLMPFFGGHPGHMDQWWGLPRLTMYEFWGCANYIGAAPLMLASLAPIAMLRNRRTRPLMLFLVALVIVGMVMAMGLHTPVFMWCYRHIPLLNLFRWPAKYAQLAVFAMPLLAGFGLHAVLDKESPVRGRCGLAVLIAWFTVWVAMAIAWLNFRHNPEFFAWLTGGAFIHVESNPEPLDRLGRDLGWAVLMLGLGWTALVLLASGEISDRMRRGIAGFLVLLTFADLYVIGRQAHPISSDEIYRRKPAQLVAALAGDEPGRIWTPYNNQDCLYGVSDPKIYDQALQSGVGESSLPSRVFKVRGGETLRINDYEDFIGLLASYPESDSTWQRAADLLNMSRIVRTARMDEMIAGVAPLDIEYDRRETALPRALVVTSWSIHVGLQETLNRLVAENHDIYRSIVVDRVPEGWPVYQPVSEGTSHAPITRLADGGIDRIEYDWNRVDITARSAGRALLFLDDVFYPGWRATVDGREVPILRANLVFRAVPLDSAGTHSVSFIYRPPQVAAGMVISLLTGILIIGLIVVSRRRGRPSRISSAASAAGARRR